jgi:hypothetical protein
VLLPEPNLLLVLLVALHWVALETRAFTLRKLECSKQANAWIVVHGIMKEGLGAILLVLGARGNG